VEAPRLEPFRPSAPQPGLPLALRDPLRIALLIGAAMLVVGSLLSWIEVFIPGTGWTDISSFARAGDGAIVLEIGVVLGLLTWADRTSTSRQPVLVALPLGLGLASLLLMKLGWDQAQAYLASLVNAGGHGYLLPGFYIALAGAVLTTIAAGAGVVRARREGVRFAVTLRRGAVIRVAGGAIGAVAGIGAAVILGEDFGTNGTVTGTAVTFLSIVFAIVGAWLGTRIGSAFAGDPGDVDTGSP
jgi:hypothetical protein